MRAAFTSPWVQLSLHSTEPRDRVSRGLRPLPSSSKSPTGPSPSVVAPLPKMQIQLVSGMSLLLFAAACGPSPECRSYVQCQQAVDENAAGIDVDVSAFDDGGSCWALPESARACTAICVQALAALRELPDPPAACVDDN